MQKELVFEGRKTSVQAMYHTLHFTLDVKSIIRKEFVNYSFSWGKFLVSIVIIIFPSSLNE